MKRPKLIGNAHTIIPMQHRKTVIRQTIEKNGKKEEYIIFHAQRICQAVFAVTTDRNVIAIRQFKNGIAVGSKLSPILTELPGGSPQPFETENQAAVRELEEETSYVPTKMMRLQQRVWYDPAIYTGRFVPWLALGCKKSRTARMSADETEVIETKLIPIRKWYKMVCSGKITDGRSLILSMLALPRLVEARII